MKVSTLILAGACTMSIAIPLLTHADAHAEQPLYSKCRGCHGKDGKGKGKKNPPIVDLETDQFIAALKEVKAGTRRTARWEAMTAKGKDKKQKAVDPLTAEDIAKLAEYVAGLK